MNELDAFFAMGGYAAFVWPAYAVTAAIMLGLLIASLRQWRANRAALEALESEGGGRRRRQTRTAPAAAGQL